MMIINLISGLIALVAVLSMVCAIVLIPFFLYKGLKNKNWKLSKIAGLMFLGGFLLQVIVLLVWSMLKQHFG